MSIENTQHRDPRLHLLLAWDNRNRYIEEMQAAGQAQIVNSNRLPVRIRGGSQADFEALGFVFGEVDSSDPMFREMALPEGWRREGSDHSRWSYVVDEQGRRRVMIFYKAAYYDRRSFMSLMEPDVTRSVDP